MDDGQKPGPSKPPAPEPLPIPRTVMMSERLQEKSIKLLSLAKKNERHNRLNRACTYYAQSLDVLATAIHYGIAFHESETRAGIKRDVKKIQKLLHQMAIPVVDDGEEGDGEETVSKIPSEEYLLANLDFDKIQASIDRRNLELRKQKEMKSQSSSSSKK